MAGAHAAQAGHGDAEFADHLKGVDMKRLTGERMMKSLEMLKMLKLGLWPKAHRQSGRSGEGRRRRWAEKAGRTNL